MGVVVAQLRASIVSPRSAKDSDSGGILELGRPSIEALTGVVLGWNEPMKSPEAKTAEVT